MTEQENLDKLVDKISKGIKKSDEIDFDKINFDELSSNKKKAYSDLYTGLPDYYKIIKAKPTDSLTVIKNKCRLLLAKYHPDKIVLNDADFETKLDKEKKIKQLEKQYELIRTAYKILTDADKKKSYDLQKKTVDNKNFLKQKDDFAEYMALQNSSISEQTKQQAKNDFEIKMIQMDTDRGYNRKMEKEALPIKKTEKMMDDMMLLRKQQEIEYQPKNLFKDVAFDLETFNKQWDKHAKRQKPKHKTNDKNVILWDGIGASNDLDAYVSTNSDYGQIFMDGTEIFSSDSDSDLSDISDTGIDTSYVFNHNKDKMSFDKTKLDDFERSRNTDFDEWSKTMFKGKSVTDNPFNPSADFGEMFASEIGQIEGPKKTTKINADLALAYEQLLFEK
jgi:curved DNA-binding protein CbpA